MGIDLNSFAANFLIGARPSKFMVTLYLPPSMQSANLQKVNFHCRATVLPEMVMGKTEVPWMGRRLPLAGDREQPDWTITIQNDIDFPVRSFLEQWNAKMGYPEGVVMDESFYPNGYFGSARIDQLSMTNKIARSYTIQHIFPLVVAAIPLDMSRANEVEDFDCTFAVWNFQVASANPDDFVDPDSQGSTPAFVP